MRMTLLNRGASNTQRGIALVSVLLFLVLMSAMSVALYYKVIHEQRLQQADSGNTASYYGAEAGMEKMMADLSLLYPQKAAPTTCDINTLQATPPPQAAVGSTYPEYVITVPGVGAGCVTPPTNTQTISSGPNSGLQAGIFRLSLQGSAPAPAGTETPSLRTADR